MTIFQSNIINIYGEKGKAWLDELSRLVSAIASKLDLRNLKEVTNLTYNYVLSGFQGDNLDSPYFLRFESLSLLHFTFSKKCMSTK